MKLIKYLLLALLLISPLTVKAQAAPPPPGEYNVSIAGGFSSTSGDATNNGFWASAAVPVYLFSGVLGKNWDASLALRGDYFTLASPQDYVATGGPEFRFQFSKAAVLNGAVFQPFVNTGFGVARSQCVSTMSCPTGADTTTHFAFKFGGGLDMPVSSSLTLRIVELDYIHSTLFPPPSHSVFVNNLAQVSTGLKFTF